MLSVGGAAGAAGRSLSLSYYRRLSLLFLTPSLSQSPHRPLSSLAAAPTAPPPASPVPPSSVDLHATLLDRLRQRHIKGTAKPAPSLRRKKKENDKSELQFGEADVCVGFGDLGLGDEIMAALSEMGISVPTEIQKLGISAILDGKSVVLGSHTGSGKTLAYLLPLVQLMRQDEIASGVRMKPRRPRAVILCPTRELTEQVYRVAKSISHHARFRSRLISGGSRLGPQEDSLNAPIDMVVGTPGRILQHVEDGNMVYGDIKYLVLDEADTMFDRGFGPDIQKFLRPLKNRATKPGDQGFQTVLVTATMTKAVQRLVDEEFQGIHHLRTSSFQKKIATARHDFINLTGSENKLEALVQVLQPSLAKGHRVMVFCNTLDSSRAVDHFLSENQISTVNYHGEVPAEERVENLNKFKSEEGDCPTLVCTDLAARGLDLNVDHVIMFDFPKTSIDYLHRTGRTARMGAKGRVSSLVAKRDILLASRIEEALKKNESLESLNINNVRKAAPTGLTDKKGKRSPKVEADSRKSRRSVVLPGKTSKAVRNARAEISKRTSTDKRGRKGPITSVAEKDKASKKRRVVVKADAARGKKLSVVSFRGRSRTTSQA